MPSNAGRSKVRPTIARDALLVAVVVAVLAGVAGCASPRSGDTAERGDTGVSLDGPSDGTPVRNDAPGADLHSVRETAAAGDGVR